MIKKVKKGFTLIELVVVIAVIAILSAVSVVAYVGITRNARNSAIKQQADQIQLAIRAAVQAEVNGYSEQEGGKRYNVTYVVIDSKNLLEIVTNTKEMTPVEVLEDIFTEVEGKEIDKAVLSIPAANMLDETIYYDCKLTTDTKLSVDKTYYSQLSEGKYAVVETPDIEDIKTYYEIQFELTTDTAIAESGKVYYTKVSEGKYAAVETPVITEIDTYYEIKVTGIKWQVSGFRLTSSSDSAVFADRDF